MSEIQIKSELLKNEIVQFLNMLKDSDDIYPILRNMFYSIIKLDNLHDNKLEMMDKILFDDFLREH